MKSLEGISPEAKPYIPKCERNTKIPTVFWMKAKTVGMMQIQRGWSEDFNVGTIIAEREIKDFINLCEKIENYELSNSKHIEVTTDKRIITEIVEDMPPEIFSEIMLEIQNWSELDGEQKKLFELLTYFALVKNQDISIKERLSYDCDSCKIMESYEERYCFKENELIPIMLPEIGEQDSFTGQYELIPGALKEIDLDKFFEIFLDISTKSFSGIPAYLALNRLQSLLSWNKEMCITGLFKVEYLQVLQMCWNCKEMSVLPYPGSYSEQPNQLIEAFDAINSTITQYEKIKVDNIGKKK